MARDELIDLVYNSDDRVEILAAFIEECVDVVAAAAQDWLGRRRVEGALTPEWFDPTFDGELAVCTAHRSIARWGRSTRNVWLLAQIAVVYSWHPFWNDEWFDGISDA